MSKKVEYRRKANRDKAKQTRQAYDKTYINRTIGMQKGKTDSQNSQIK